MASENPSPEDKLRYDAAKKELMQALSKRRNVDRQLSQLEVQIYNLEASYLTETAAHSGGNILHGFEGYLKNPAGGRKKHELGDSDRMFSNSSTTYKKSLELSGEGEESGAGEDQSRMSTPGLTTVIVPPAPRPQELSAAQQKKNRDREYQRKKRASARATATPMSEDDSHSVASSGRRPSKRARLADDD
ncbi:NuA4-domain-containing protein [Daedalea quercina L-15889]|uniref:Chromatin modification-related protein EAF6 n=1 Tax=Daedalea quercina L-15889 TaxID=1314783 RepID=A0A165TTC2_9APHY|nr:NuA4-domain-containing protein [Daedalea quercina L-15889]